MDGELSTPNATHQQTPAQTGGGSPAPQPGAAGTPPAASPTGASAGPGAAQPQNGGSPRTYSDAEVQNIVRERLASEQKKYAPYKELGDAAEIRARLDEHKRLKEAFHGSQTPQPTPEEVELRELLTKQFPGIDKVQSLEQKLAAIEQANYAAKAEAGRGVISKLAAEKLGVSDAGAVNLIEGAVAASIQADKAALAAWMKGDMSVVEKHFANVMGTGLEPLLKSAASRYSAGKAKDMAEVPPSVPRGGTQAPISSERKLTSEERRDAAWKKLQELEGQG
jgi:hypothetical protein